MQFSNSSTKQLTATLLSRPRLKLLAFFCSVIFSQTLFAQGFTRIIAGIQVEQNGKILEFPFIGGLDRFQPQFVDIDDDGDHDLFMAMQDGRLWFLENNETVLQRKFKLVTETYSDLNVNSWFYFLDIDTDGDFDLYHANGSGGLAFHRNIGTPSAPDFDLENETVLQANGEEVLSEFTSIPSFADIDADGDYDFFTGISTGRIAL